MFIQCERLQEHGHESFLVTVSNKGPIVMGSDKGRKFMEERMGLIEDFIYFCMGKEKITKKYYENLPMQYTEIFLAVKIENFICRKFLIFFLSLLKT